MAHPAVSILTPTYNQAGLLGACLSSALAQTRPDWELVVADDGSTDGTAEVAARIGDPRIRVLRLPHRGMGALAETYDAALSASRGELVAILEGDDAWPADKLERQVPAFDDPAVQLCWGRGTVIDEAGAPKGELRVFARDVRLSTRSAFRSLLGKNLFIPAVSVMVRRAALERTGGFRQDGARHFVDLPTWLWLTATCEGDVLYLDRALGCWRAHAGQATARKYVEMVEDHASAVGEFARSAPRETLARIGWDARCERTLEAALAFARGLRGLEERRRAAAAASFGRGLLRAGTVDLAAKNAAGLASAVTGIDLVSLARRLAPDGRARAKR